MSQLQHSPRYVGGPCSRCGLRYSRETSYVPCFETGDTFAAWALRQNVAVLAHVDESTPGFEDYTAVRLQPAGEIDSETPRQLGGDHGEAK